MPEPTPPLTACELLTLFNRSAAQEPYAQVRVDQADYCERLSLDKLRVNQWKKACEEWRP
jgi:hypothetical protein